MRTKQILNFGLDLILPPSCVVCRARLSAHGLCGACWADLQPITDPLCSACGRPLPYAMRTDLCGACHIRLPEVRPLRALYRYNEMTRRLVVPFKHSDRLDMLPMLQRMMAQRFSELTANSPLVVPVPLHRWRFSSAAIIRQQNWRADCARPRIPHTYISLICWSGGNTLSVWAS